MSVAAQKTYVGATPSSEEEWDQTLVENMSLKTIYKTTTLK